MVEEKKIKKKRTRKKKKEIKIAFARGKKKDSIARARIIPGKGRIIFNKQNIDALQNKYIRALIYEPVKFIGPEFLKMDIRVNVKGGGVLGQALAARVAISNAIVKFLDNGETIKKQMVEYDRNMIVEDSRRVEPKKYHRKGARARKQKSYR